MVTIGLMGKEEGRASSVEDGCKSIKWILGLILLLFTLILAAILVNGLVLLPAKDANNTITANMTNQSISADKMPPETSVWAAIIILAIVFLVLLYMGCAVDGSLDQGEMRRAIAGTFVLGFTMLIFFLARFEVANRDIITSYLQMVGVIIGFYFGAKTALAGTSSESSEGLGIASEGLGIAILNVDKAKKEISLNIKNKGDNELKVDKVYIMGKSGDRDFTKSEEVGGVKINPKSLAPFVVTLDGEPDPGSVIKITVLATVGLTRLAEETEYTWPSE